MNIHRAKQQVPYKVRRVERATRYECPSGIEVISRPYGMRFYRFPLEVVNLSHTGFLLTTVSDALVPFKVGTVIQITVDLYGQLFARPLHFDVIVNWIDSEGERTVFGVGIESQIEEQKILYNLVFSKLTPVY